MTDDEIIELFFDRNEEAIFETEKRYGAYCRKISENILKNSEDSEEILNSVWLGIWNSVPPNRPQNLRIYLAKITRSLAVNRMKEKTAAKRSAEISDSPFDELSECLPSGDNTEESFIAKELSESINHFIEKLPEKERNIFIRRYFFGENLSEIGERYNISENSTAVILFRTRKKLKKHLKGGLAFMTKNDLIFAIGEISDDFIEKSEQKKRRNPFGKFGSLAASAVLILAFSVTAVAAANFFNTLHGGNLAFMEAAGGYVGDIYSIKLDIDVAEDAEYEITDYYVPMFFEENWVDCGGEACETHSVLVYDNYDENLYAIFQQFPAAYNKNGEGSLVYNVPAGTKFRETYFEIDGEKLYCIETEAHDDGFRGDPFGTRILFWSDGYHFFELETRLTMDEKTLREAVRSVKKVDDISDYSIFNEIGDGED